jgi:hypothetical protein
MTGLPASVPSAGREPTKQTLGRRVAAACIVTAGAILVCAIYAIGLTDKNATERDYIQYWAAGQLLVHHANPYSLEAILKIEQAVGLEGIHPKISVGPPVTLEFLAPLGFVGAKTGLIAWLLVELVCLALSIWIFWIVSGKPDSRYHLFGYAFAPVLACLQAGQLGIFMLFGIVLFLFFRETRPFLAGVVLLPCTLKPHLFLPFVAALLLWTVFKKSYVLVAGFLVSLLASCGLTLLFDHRLWIEYVDLMRSSRLMQIQLPTLSSDLRFWIAPDAVWLQYLPSLLAAIWAVIYFWTRRHRWNWNDHGQLVLLVGVMCAPYAWLTDEAVLLPAMLFGVYRAIENRRSLLPILLINAIALAEIFAGLGITAWYYTWTTPAWLAWYLFATHRTTASGRDTDTGRLALNAVP